VGSPSSCYDVIFSFKRRRCELHDGREASEKASPKGRKIKSEPLCPLKEEKGYHDHSAKTGTRGDRGDRWQQPKREEKNNGGSKEKKKLP